MKRALLPSPHLILTIPLLIAGVGVLLPRQINAEERAAIVQGQEQKQAQEQSQNTKPETYTVFTDAETVGALPALEIPEDFHAQPQLNEQAEVYLVTIYPGEALYSSFGHTAIRIKDPSSGIDILYNYGQSSIPFDSGFVPHFVKGQLPFMLGVVNAERAYNFYIKYEDRTIYEQKLNLSHKEKVELYSFLAYNALPENRVYIYDFFFDNCTTRIRDIFTYLYGSSLTYRLPEQKKSFREIIAPYLSHTPYVTLGINLVFGSASDKRPSLEDRLFLPFQLMDAAETALTGAAPQTPGEKNLEEKTRFIYHQQRGEPEPPAVSPGLLLWFLAAAAVGFSMSPYRRSLPARIMDVLIFGFIGVLGSMMLLLWLFSGYEMTTGNYNILWAWPTHLAVVFFGFNAVRRHRFLFYYFAASAAAAAVFIAASPLIPQTLPSAAVPLILALAVRSLNRIIFLPYSRVAEKHTSR